VPLSLCEIFFIEGKKKKKDFELNFINKKKPGKITLENPPFQKTKTKKVKRNGSSPNEI